MKILPENADSKLVAQLLSDFVKAKEKIQMPKKSSTAGGGKSFSYKYAGLDTVFDAINKGTAGTGINFMQETVQHESMIGVKNYIVDQCGAYIEYEPIMMPINADRQKNAAQSLGSLLTYLRRYSVSAIFGIAAEEDDDGNSYGGYSKQSYPQQNRQQRQTPKPVKQLPKTAAQARIITMTYNGTPTNLSTVFSHAMLKDKKAGEFLKEQMKRHAEVKVGVELLTREAKEKQEAAQKVKAQQAKQTFEQTEPASSEAPEENPLEQF